MVAQLGRIWLPMKERQFYPWVRKIAGRRKELTHSTCLGYPRRSLVGYSLWDCKESDTTD